MKRYLVTCAVLAGLTLATTPGRDTGHDWPQYRGADRDGFSSETGLLTTWPASGPPELWRAPLGEGYSGISAVGDRLYTMYRADDFSLVANPISRYAINSRMQLRHEDDGALDLILSNEAPAAGTENWLPTPEGGFYMIFRTYLPGSGIVEMSWMPPSIERIDD